MLFTDGSILRTCAPIAIDDCEVANGVTYCYCKNELCNKPGRRLPDPNPGSGMPSPINDRRDIIIDNSRSSDDKFSDTTGNYDLKSTHKTYILI